MLSLAEPIPNSISGDAHPLRVGTHVRVEVGALAGFQGQIVDSIGEDRVRLRLEGDRAGISLEIDRWAIEQVVCKRPA